MKTIKITIIAVLVPLLFWVNTFKIFSQDGPVRERIQTERIAFFTEKLDLSSGEAEKFWPVYNDYTNRKEQINREMQNQRMFVARNASNMSDAEMEEYLNNFLNYQNDEHALFQEYHAKFLDILPVRKVMMLYIAETQFKQYLLQKLREREGYQGRRR